MSHQGSDFHGSLSQGLSCSAATAATNSRRIRTNCITNDRIWGWSQSELYSKPDLSVCIQNPITVLVFKTRSQYLSPRKGLHGAAGQRSVNYSDARAQCHDGLCVVLHFVGVFADDDRFLCLLQESAEGIEGVLGDDQRLRLCVFPLLSALLARRARLPVPTGSTH